MVEHGVLGQALPYIPRQRHDEELGEGALSDASARLACMKGDMFGTQAKLVWTGMRDQGQVTRPV